MEEEEDAKAIQENELHQKNFKDIFDLIANNKEKARL